MLERVEIGSRARLGMYVAAALGQTPVAGAEAEFNAALGIRADQVPLAMLIPDEGEEPTAQRADGDEKEYFRADAVTDLSGDTPPIGSGRFLARVFQMSQARWLGVTFESVPVGQRVHTVFTGGATADTVARAARKDSDAATLDTITMEGNRLTSRYRFAVEDLARIPQIESRLRSDLSMTMSTQMDNAIFNGDAGLTTANGFKGGLTGDQNIRTLLFTGITSANLHWST